jgi:hypothetical protein
MKEGHRGLTPSVMIGKEVATVRFYERVKADIAEDLVARGYLVWDHSDHTLMVKRKPESPSTRVIIKRGGAVHVEGECAAPGEEPTGRLLNLKVQKEECR